MEKDNKKAKTLLNPINETDLRAGNIIHHNDFGIGIVIGFSSITNNPCVFFYEENEIYALFQKEVRKL